MAELISTNKHNNKIALNGHIYVKERQYKGKIYWKCQYFKTSCRGRLVSTVPDGCEVVTSIDLMEKIEERGTHNHFADISKVEAIKAYNKIKEDAIKSYDSSNQIIEQRYSNLHDSIASKLPSLAVMKESIRKIRNKNRPSITPTKVKNDESEQQLQPSEYELKTMSGESFVIFDSGEVADRIIVFGCKDDLLLLAESEDLYFNGSFKLVPNEFKKLYTIHSIIDKTPLPLLFILLPNDTQETYLKLLKIIKEFCPTVAPKSIIIDFEKGMVEAAKLEFPGAEIRGCYYHFLSSVMSSVNKNGFQSSYDCDLDFNSKIKLLLAIAYVPPNHVVHYFHKLMDSNIFTENEIKIIEYFRNTFIGQYSFMPAQFSIQMWNFFDLFKNDMDKTNTNIEMWHRIFDAKLSQNFWKFIQVIKKEEQNIKNKIVQMRVEMEKPKKRKAAKEQLILLHKHVLSFDVAEDPITYLRNISSLL